MTPYPEAKLCVAPMMRWTDRHCRYLHRLYAPDALLFTEMVTSAALINADPQQLLAHDVSDHPLVLQLGGNQPDDLAKCARLAATLGFAEVNLNVGCPSDRVQKGTFGACLMRQPKLVAQCVNAMRSATDSPISVKCRLGVDHFDSDALLDDFIGQVRDAGCGRFYIHARKAILGGLTPAQNRSIPPLQPWRAQRIKQLFPELAIIVNGGITNSEMALADLAWSDGVMIGRAAYHQPDLLRELQELLFAPRQLLSKPELLHQYQQYAAQQLNNGIGLHQMTRHLLSSCNGLPGARRFRRILSDQQRLKSNQLSLIEQALNEVALC